MDKVTSVPTDKERAEYTLKAALCRIDSAFKFINQYRANWKFPALFVSDTFMESIRNTAEYFPLSSSWHVQANHMLRHSRYKRALVIHQSGSSSTLWHSVSDFMACFLATSFMNKGEFVFGNGSRGKDIIDLSFYSAQSKTGQQGYRISPHYCEINSLHDWVINGSVPGTDQYRRTASCLTFFDYIPHQKSKVQVPLNQIFFCKACGKYQLSTADYAPSAIERMYKYVIKGI
jgi:hypothetical protein